MELEKSIGNRGHNVIQNSFTNVKKKAPEDDKKADDDEERKTKEDAEMAE